MFITNDILERFPNLDTHSKLLSEFHPAAHNFVFPDGYVVKYEAELTTSAGRRLAEVRIAELNGHAETAIFPLGCAEDEWGIGTMSFLVFERNYADPNGPAVNLDHNHWFTQEQWYRYFDEMLPLLEQVVAWCAIETDKMRSELGDEICEGYNLMCRETVRHFWQVWATQLQNWRHNYRFANEYESPFDSNLKHGGDYDTARAIYSVCYGLAKN